MRFLHSIITDPKNVYHMKALFTLIPKMYKKYSTTKIPPSCLLIRPFVQKIGIHANVVRIIIGKSFCINKLAIYPI